MSAKRQLFSQSCTSPSLTVLILVALWLQIVIAFPVCASQSVMVRADKQKSTFSFLCSSDDTVSHADRRGFPASPALDTKIALAAPVVDDERPDCEISNSPDLENCQSIPWHRSAVQNECAPSCLTIAQNSRAPPLP